MPTPPTHPKKSSEKSPGAPVPPSSGAPGQPMGALGRLGRGLGKLIPVAAPVPIPAPSPVPVPTQPRSAESSKPGASAAPTASASAAPGASLAAATTAAIAAPDTRSAVVKEVASSGARRLPAAAPTPAAAGTRGAAPAGASQSRTEAGESQGVASVPIKAVHPNPLQPRQHFDKSAIEGLASSIQQAGLIQPIVVRETKPGFYELIAGERRWRAAQHLGWDRIPALIRPITDEEAGYWSIIENVQREELNPMERAEGLDRLRTRFGLTQASLAERLGMDRASVANLLRLVDLDQATADLVRSGAVSLGHAKVLLGVSDSPQRASFAKQCAREGWSVRQLEHEVKSLATTAPGSGATVGSSTPGRLPQTQSVSAHIANLERELGDHLGTRVAIRLGRKAGTGKIVIEFFSLDQFDGLTDRMGYRQGS